MLQLQDVTKVYRMGAEEVRALDSISFEVADGDFVAIMGPSGAGKSSLMHIIGCLDRPTSGAYLISGQDVSGFSSDTLAEVRNKEIGFVFQQFNLLPRETVLANVEVPLMYAGVPAGERRRKAAEALERVGLGDRIHHRPAQISGGQRQRVAIARALINNPSLILADEPTGNLDSWTGTEIMTILEDLNTQGTTVLVVTHERRIADYANRIIHLKDGSVERVESSRTGRKGPFNGPS